MHFHLFVSHVWKTGQDQTHTLVRQLQLMLPGIRIWLDVVNLDDIGKLEEVMANAAVMLIFLSSGYFASHNCRREVYAALTNNKPIEAMIEADKDKGGELGLFSETAPRFRRHDFGDCRRVGATVEEMQAEARRCFAPQVPGIPSAEDVVARVFSRDPVPWLRLNDYQARGTQPSSSPPPVVRDCYVAPIGCVAKGDRLAGAATAALLHLEPRRPESRPHTAWRALFVPFSSALCYDPDL